MFRQTIALLFALALPTSAFAAQPAKGAGTFETADHVTLHYDIEGDGAPAIFVHGGPGSGSGAFQVLAGAAFEHDYRMIYLDQRGSGHSGSPADGDYALDRQIEDLDALRAHLGLERWTVVSYSFGGLIAQAYAAKHPEHVASMILVNSLLDLGQSMQSTYERGLSLIPEQARPHFDDATPFPQKYFTVLAMLQQMHLSWQLQYASEATMRATEAKIAGRDFGSNHDMSQGIYRTPPTSYLVDLIATTKDTDVPVLVIAGEDDATVGPQHTRFAYPHQTVVVLPGRHLTFAEAPKAFADAIHGFATAARHETNAH